MFRFISLNKVQCNVCKDYLVSNPEKESVLETCSCGNTSIRGGATALYRKGKQFTEMSEFNFEDCPEVRTDVAKRPSRDESVNL